MEQKILIFYLVQQAISISEQSSTFSILIIIRRQDVFLRVLSQ